MVAGNDEVRLALLVALLPAFYALVTGVLQLSEAGNKKQIWVESPDIIHNFAVQVKFILDLEHLRIVSLKLPRFSYRRQHLFKHPPFKLLGSWQMGAKHQLIEAGLGNVHGMWLCVRGGPIQVPLYVSQALSCTRQARGWP